MKTGYPAAARIDEILVQGPAAGFCDFVEITVEPTKVEMHYLRTPSNGVN
jgi:hypothetical protein